MEKTTKITRPAAQHSTAQHSTAQHSTAQHSTAHRCKDLLKNFWALLLIPVLLLTIINCETDQTEINNLNQRIDALTIANNNLRAQISTITGTTTTMTGNTATITSLQNQLNQLQNTLSGSNATISGLQNQLSTLSGSEASTEQINTLQNEINYLNRHKYVYNYDVNVLSSVYSAIFSNGETMWIVGTTINTLLAYNTTTISGIKMRVESKEFSTISFSGNGTNVVSPVSIYSDGTTMWFITLGEFEYKAFTLSTGRRDMGKDFSLDSENSKPRGSSWSDGTTLWVSDINDDKIYAYDMVTKARKPREDFNTLSGAGNTSPGSLWSDGETMWVANVAGSNEDRKIYAYNLQTKARVPSQDFDNLSAPFTSINGLFNPMIWSDGRTMWIGDGDGLRNARIIGFDMVTKMPR